MKINNNARHPKHVPALLFSLVYALIFPLTIFALPTSQAQNDKVGLPKTYNLSIDSGGKVTDLKNEIQLEWVNAGLMKLSFRSSPGISLDVVPKPDHGAKGIIAARQNLTTPVYIVKEWCSGCFNEITLDSSSDGSINAQIATAKVDIDFLSVDGTTPIDSGGRVAVSIAKPELSNAYFRWIDSGQIEPVGDLTIGVDPANHADSIKTIPSLFVRDQVNLDLYVATSEVACKDKILIKDDGKSMKYFLLVPNGALSDNDNYEGQKPSNELDIKDIDDPQCQVVNIREDGHLNEGLIDVWDFYRVPPMSDTSYSMADFINKQKSPETGTSNKNSGTDTSGPQEPSCESEGGSFSWLMCPALELVSGILNFIDSQLNSLLNLPDSYYKCQPDGSGCTVKNAWSRMRNLAYIILIPIMLVMVISTALGFKFVDAYTVKRAMPRLLAAVIFISLSLPIVTIMADIANGVGKGIMGLILGAVTGNNANSITLASLFDPGLASGGLLTAGLVVAGGIAIGLIGAILLFGLTAVASILVLFFVMALRQMLLVTLMIVAPLAILSWIFPGNDKLWKIWKESFTKLLLLYPIVMLLIASGKAFAYIVDGVGSGFINTILILVAYIGPYFLIKGTFKMAGSIFGNLSGMVNDRGKGVFDRLGKARQKKYQDKWHKARSGRYFNRASEGSLKNWANRKIENISNQGLGGVELRPTVRKARMKAALDERAFDHAMEASEKLPGARAHFASDVLMLAGLEGQGDRTRTMDYFRKKGISEHEAMLNTESVLAMRNAMGAEAYELAAIAKLPGTGTAFEERDTSRWHQHVGRVSHGNAGLEASLVAAGKSGFRNAQRTEVSEAGFSDHMQAVKMARNARTQKELDEITNFIVDKSYEGGGPAAVVYSRNAKVANMFAEAMERSIIKAERSGDHRIEMRAKAAVAAVHEQLGQAKQVVSTVLGDRFFGKEVQYKVPVVQEKIIGEGSEKTIIRDTEYVDKTGSRLDEIQSHKGDRVFQETKFEYGQVSAEIADRLRASQPQQGQNQPGQVKPPLGGIPGQP